MDRNPRRTPSPDEECPHCGHWIIRPRSLIHHNVFFAVLAQMFESWPEANFIRPVSAEHLRAVLICRAGEYMPIDEATSAYDAHACEEERQLFAADLIEAARKKKRFVFRQRFNDGLWRMVTPVSMSEEVMHQARFREVFERIFADVKAMTGIDGHELIKDFKRKSVMKDGRAPQA